MNSTASLELKRKYDKKFSRIVCWVCKRWRVPLRKLDEYDYACDEHFALGKPGIGNQSRERYE